MKSNFETNQGRSIGRKFPPAKPVVLSAVTHVTLSGSTRASNNFRLASRPKSGNLELCLFAQVSKPPRLPRILPQSLWDDLVAVSADAPVLRRSLPSNAKLLQKKPRKLAGQRKPRRHNLSSLGLTRPPSNSFQSTSHRKFVLTYA